MDVCDQSPVLSICFNLRTKTISHLICDFNMLIYMSICINLILSVEFFHREDMYPFSGSWKK